jgi:hypothetical protein
MGLTYKNIHGDLFDLESMGEEELEVLRKVVAHYETQPEWTSFSQFWLVTVHLTFQRKWTRHQIVRSDLFRICQDFESRLGIAQGKIRKPEEWDALQREHAKWLKVWRAKNGQNNAAKGGRKTSTKQVARSARVA